MVKYAAFQTRNVRGYSEGFSARGPMKLTHVMYKANVNCNVLKEYLGFLIKQGLIEERVVGKGRVVYSNTARGTTVLTYFRELHKAFPILEEDGKILPALY